MELVSDNIDFQITDLFLPMIILIGPPGAGKTAVGEYLAKDLGWNSLDTDAVIEQATDIKITDIFSRFGEDIFRKLEKALVEHLCTLSKTSFPYTHNKGQGTVLSCGGGLPVPPENFFKLSKLGTIVALQAPANILMERVSSMRHRPLLDTNTDGEPEDNRRSRLESLIKQRKEIYEQATLIIDTSNKTIDAVARDLRTKLGL